MLLMCFAMKVKYLAYKHKRVTC